MRSFTTEELERATGFDRRTIAYYVQKGLIPKVGRRGPRTRYPKLVMDRLLCIRRVREAEEAGEIEAVSLGAMQAIFGRVSAELIARVADGETPVATAFAGGDRARRALAPRSAGGDGRLLVCHGGPRTFQAIRVRIRRQDTAETAFVPGNGCGTRNAIGGTSAPGRTGTRRQTSRWKPRRNWETPSRNCKRARANRQRKPGSLDRWSRVEISPDVAISVRGVTDEDVPLLESVGKKLRRLISDRKDRPER